MKANRRQFLPAGSVVAALPSALVAAELQSTQTGLIDCQSHLFCPEVLALFEHYLDPDNVEVSMAQLEYGQTQRPRKSLFTITARKLQKQIQPCEG